MNACTGYLIMTADLTR